MKQEQLERAKALVTTIEIGSRRLTKVDDLIAKIDKVTCRIHYKEGTEEDYLELDASIVEATLQAQRNLILTKLTELQTEFESL